MASKNLNLFGPAHTGEGGMVSTQKALALLAYLALSGKPVARTELAELLWGSESDPNHSLRQELVRLGKALPGWVVKEGKTLALTHVECDVSRFEAAIEHKEWSQAIGLYGSLLVGLEVKEAAGFERWLENKRRELGEHYAKALREQAKAQEPDHPQEALKLYRMLLVHDELQEEIHRLVMALHAKLGQRSAALAQFERCKEALKRELDLEPLVETVNLARSIRNQAVVKPVKALAGPKLEVPLVGREEAWEQMEAAWQTGKSILVTGDPGIGKTRLMREFISTKGPFLLNEGRPGDSIFTLVGRTVKLAFQRSPALSLPDWLRRELARVMPELWPHEVLPPVEGGRARMYQAWFEFLLILGERNQYRTLWSDDLQFFDSLSLDIGMYATGRIAELTQKGLIDVRVVGSYRKNELQPKAADLMDRFIQSGFGVLIELKPLTQPQVFTLVQTMSGGLNNSGFPKRLHQTTAGNPLFIIETLHSLFSDGSLRLEEGRWVDTNPNREITLPRSVRQTVMDRINRLGAPVRRLLDAACLVVDGFGLETLSEATALSEWEQVEALEKALSAQLLTDLGYGYRFYHDLIQRSLQESLGKERKRLLHQKLAEALVRLEGDPAQIADHWEKAGKPKVAVEWRIKAAEAAARAYATQEALEQYRLALGNGATGEIEVRIRQAQAKIALLAARQESLPEQDRDIP